MEYCFGCLSTTMDLLIPDQTQIEMYQELVFSKLDSKIKLLDLTTFRFCKGCKHLLDQIIEFQSSCEKAAIFLINKYSMISDVDSGRVCWTVKQEEQEENYFPEDDFNQIQDVEEDLNLGSIIKVEVSESKSPKLERLMRKVKSKIVKKKPKKSNSNIKGGAGGESFCNFCQLLFPNHSQDASVITFKEHLLNEHATFNADQSVTCKFCNTKLSSSKTITHHFKWNHVVENANLKCTHCENTFRNSLTLNTHIKYYHKTLPRSFICDLCNKRFKQKNDLIRHMNRKHITEARCEFCQTTFGSQEECKIHKKECRAMFICHICGSKLLSKISLRNHIIGQHLPPPPCDICGKPFLRKQDLDHHKVMEHTEKNFVCDVCAKTFHTQNGLNSHVKFTHLKQENRYSRAKQWCEICKKWESSTTKSNHELKAKLGRRYPCMECELSFFHAHQLKRHMFTHSKLRPYNCKMCQAGYYHVSYLKAHYQRTHGSEYLGAIIKQPNDHVRMDNQPVNADASSC